MTVFIYDISIVMGTYEPKKAVIQTNLRVTHSIARA